MNKPSEDKEEPQLTPRERVFLETKVLKEGVDPDEFVAGLRRVVKHTKIAVAIVLATMVDTFFLDPFYGDTASRDFQSYDVHEKIVQVRRRLSPIHALAVALNKKSQRTFQTEIESIEKETSAMILSRCVQLDTTDKIINDLEPFALNMRLTCAND